MTKILLSGCCGKMGRTVTNIVNTRDDCQIVAGVDIVEDSTLGYPVFQTFSEVQVKADVIVDFSNPALLLSMLEYAKSTNTAVVISTTGLSDEQIKTVEEFSREIPVFFSYNMSMGVSLLCELCKTTAKVLGNDFDIEIVEAHHNQKLDAPSGTAIMLADAIKEEIPEVFYEYDRHSKRQKRNEKEIGIHSIRGGNIVGEHNIFFFGQYETLEIKHSALSRDLFAEGALKAAEFLLGQQPGFYNMDDMISM